MLKIGFRLIASLLPLNASALILDNSPLIQLPVDDSAPASENNSIFNAGPMQLSALPISSDTDSAADNDSALPDLGSSLNHSGDNVAKKFETQIATALKEFGEGSKASTSDDPLREQAESLALQQAARLMQKKTSSLLSPLGTASMNLDVSGGTLAGSSGQLLSPLLQSADRLTYSQVGLQHTSDANIGNFGLGQRWSRGHWMLGYNAFVDNDFTHDQSRGSLGAEAWTDYLHFSANYYHPFSSFKAKYANSTLMRRQAAGYDITTKGYLPFYRQLGASISFEQYQGNQVDLLGNGVYQNNPSAMSLGVNYTPVPLVTFKAEHKQGQAGDNQDVVNMTLNYRLGVPLAQQLSPDYVAQAHSLRGGRLDTVERNNLPVLEYRQRKTLSVFLATPPWVLQAGDNLPLKLDVRAINSISALSWQGDTQALSLTPPHNNRDVNGWSVIMPAWDDTPGASNTYRLSVTVVDNKHQQVTSNWITLSVAQPLSASISSEAFSLAPATQ